MKRSDRVYTFVVERTSHLTAADFAESKGVTTEDVVKALNIQRSNASRDLNELVREGLLIKSSGRPVRYIANFSAENIMTNKNKHEPEIKHSVFESLIGASQSLKLSVEQAKAAVLYPPKGLNCLITGATGSGKSYFAKLMFEFAQENKLIDYDKKLIIFNCADYSHNTELLMSHLFGYAKGAFTGADQEKEGLIYEANDSMLFLDEVHRLPPEGQEMIFYFMDHGTYNRLGETTKNRQANVRIICATTEEPASALLNTFIRRIPINIQLPNFNQRTPREKIDLTIRMFAIEAERIQRDIILTADVVKAIIGSVTFGNVGQLKSHVQLVCARGFLNHLGDEHLIIDVDGLPSEMKKGLSEIVSHRQTSMELAQLLEPKMVISPNQVDLSKTPDAYELPYDLYEWIGEKATVLREEGVPQEKIIGFMMEDIQNHLSQFYKNHGLTLGAENNLVELVDPELIDLTKKIRDIAIEELEYDFQVNFIYALSLHISAYLRRAENGSQEFLESNESIKEIVRKCPKEYKVALTIKELLAEKYQVELPVEETDYLTLLIVSLKEDKSAQQIGIVVAAHGESTASSMVQVAVQLFGNENVVAVDMPVEMPPKEALELMVAAAEKVRSKNGILLLVDMGSLFTFEEEIMQRTGLKVRTIDMVTTALVLEAARKTKIIDTDLNRLFDSLKNFYGYSQVKREEKPSMVVKPAASDKIKAIVAICASGKGAAERMKSIISEQLGDYYRESLKILPISVINMLETLKNIREEYDLVAITGLVDPDIDVPYFSMETLLSGKAVEELQDLLLTETVETAAASIPAEIDELEARELCREGIENYFTFINPAKVIDPLWEFTDRVNAYFTPRASYSSYLNVVMHMAGVLERAARHDNLSAEIEQINDEKETKLYDIVVKEIRQLEEIFSLQFSDEEIFYTIQNIKNTLAKNSVSTKTTH